MFRRFAAALVMLVVCGAILVAAEYRGQFLGYDKDKGITVRVFGKKKGDEAEEKTFKVSKNVKVFEGKREGKKLVEGDEIKDGLKSDKLEAKKSFVRIVTDDDGNVTKVIVAPPRKKKE